MDAPFHSPDTGKRTDCWLRAGVGDSKGQDRTEEQIMNELTELASSFLRIAAVGYLVLGLNAVMGQMPVRGC